MFRANPGFQMAVILLVMFISYVWQVKHQPYMSTSQRKEVVRDHRRKAMLGIPKHVKIANQVKISRDTERKKKHRSNLRRHSSFDRVTRSMSDSQLGSSLSSSKAPLKEKQYFWDFNTVEQVLISCAILVCLSGVMFESDRFKGSTTFGWMGDVLGYLTIFVILFSLVYYISVVASEICGCTPKFVQKLFANKDKQQHRHHPEYEGTDLVSSESDNNDNEYDFDDDLNDISIIKNPKFLKQMQHQNAETKLDDSVSIEVELSSIDTFSDSAMSYAKRRRNSKSMNNQNKLNETESQQYKEKIHKRKGRMNKKNKKKSKPKDFASPNKTNKNLEQNRSRMSKEFGGRKIELTDLNDDNNINTNNNNINQNSNSVQQGSDNNKYQNPLNKNKNKNEIHMDSATGRRYSYNTQSGVSLWLQEEKEEDEQQQQAKKKTIVEKKREENLKRIAEAQNQKLINDNKQKQKEAETEAEAEEKVDKRTKEKKVDKREEGNTKKLSLSKKKMRKLSTATLAELEELKKTRIEEKKKREDTLRKEKLMKYRQTKKEKQEKKAILDAIVVPPFPKKTTIKNEKDDVSISSQKKKKRGKRPSVVDSIVMNDMVDDDMVDGFA